MIRMPAKGICAVALAAFALAGAARAADPLPLTTRIVAASTAAPPTQVSFSIATAQDLVVTLTDLQIPAALTSAGFVVTQAGAVAVSGQLAPPATTATASLPGATGAYTLYVFGVPNANDSVGQFTVCVAPKASPSNCIQSASTAGFITAQSTAKDPTISTLSQNLTVTTAGSYTFTFGDLQFPVALSTPPTFALFQGSTPVALGITSGTAITLNPGTYQLLGIAQADPTVKSGLYNLTIGVSGAMPLLDTVEPVGTTPTGSPFNNPSAQNVVVTVSDYAFPGALASASALLTSGGTVIGTANAAGGAATFAAPAGGLQLWTYGAAGSTAGTYSVDVSAPSGDLYTTAQGVGPSGTTYAYAFVTSPLAAGNYQATAGDLQFPSQLTSLSFAVAQNGAILKQSTTATALAFTAVAGNAVLLVSAQAPATSSATGDGLFDVNVQSTGASAALVFDKTQSVSTSGALFDSQTLTLGVNSSFDASLTDLKFPTAFDNLALVVSRGTEIEGKIFGGGQFSFSGAPGTYQLTFVATPSASQLFGLYSTSIVFSPPTVTLSSDVTSAATGSTVNLTWTSANATSCTGSGGTFIGSQATSGTKVPVVLSATTTYTLTCTGTAGSASQSVTVTATAAKSSGGGGGGALDSVSLIVGGGLLLAQARRRRVAADRIQ